MEEVTLSAPTVITVPTTANIKQMNKDALKAALTGIVEQLEQHNAQSENGNQTAHTVQDTQAVESHSTGSQPTGDMAKLMEQIQHMVRIVESQEKALEDLKTQQHNSNEMLRSVSGEIMKIVTVLDIDDMDNDDVSDEMDADQLKDILMLGDSMIRDVKATCEDLTVLSIGGAKICHLKKHLKSIKPKNKKYKRLLIICGTNEVSTNKTNDQIVKECDQLILLAKERAQEVHFSSILPRMDEKVEQNKIDALNQLLVPLCNSHQVKFINHDCNFKYRDNSIDETLLLPVDKLHLSFQGVKRLLQNLQLQEMAKPSMSPSTTTAGTVSATPSVWSTPLTSLEAPAPPPQRDQDRQTNVLKFRGAKSSFSNFYMTPIDAWNFSFKSVEHAYTYYKAMTMNEPALADEILICRTAKNAKDIGDTISTNDHWLKSKKNVMFYLLQQKARQCQKFNDDLKASQNKVLVEDTANNYWGRGKNGTGENVLGRLLMTLRQKLPVCNVSLDSQRAFNDNSLHPPPKFPTRPNPVSQHQSRPQPRYPPRPRYIPRTRQSPQQQIDCYNCGEKSHTVDSCRHPYPLRCYSCSGEGHKRKSCPVQENHHNNASRTFYNR